MIVISGQIYVRDSGLYGGMDGNIGEIFQEMMKPRPGSTFTRSRSITIRIIY